MDGKKLIELKQERATVTNSIRNIMTEFENAEMSAEKKEELTKNENRFDEINGLILREEKQLSRERAIGEKANDDNKAQDEGRIRMRAELMKLELPSVITSLPEVNKHTRFTTPCNNLTQRKPATL